MKQKKSFKPARHFQPLSVEELEKVVKVREEDPDNDPIGEAVEELPGKPSGPPIIEEEDDLKLLVEMHNDDLGVKELNF
ncbi:MAG: hypothetical protein PHO56_02300 [Patescibacteria group bacterium]|nr:hypothetical protein [Patescibacteria group bacterium]